MAEMAIVTLEGDIHAYLVQQALSETYGIDVAIVAADRIPAAGGVAWDNGNPSATTLPTEEGGTVDISRLRLVWWRRCHGRPEVPDTVTDRAMRQLVVKDSRAATRGAFLAAFTGTWLSDPYATERAQNKLLQLRIAREVGLTVPRTLVSSDPSAIREFTRAMGGRVIGKTLTGLLGTGLEAGRIRSDSLTDENELRLSPTIFQEEVAGTDHLRVQVFGSDVYAAKISSAALDWRLAGDMQVQPATVSEALQDALRAVVDRLGLRMGIFDLKIRPDGSIVFLEINPQGQFLFVEGMSDMPLTAAFARFAANELTLVSA
jgi:glutathione synthase/RimK-type ligase-like ATP-grasp enzyme